MKQERLPVVALMGSAGYPTPGSVTAYIDSLSPSVVLVSGRGVVSRTVRDAVAGRADLQLGSLALIPNAVAPPGASAPRIAARKMLLVADRVALFGPLPRWLRVGHPSPIIGLLALARDAQLPVDTFDIDGKEVRIPMTPADPRPGGVPFFIDPDCPRCGAPLQLDVDPSDPLGAVYFDEWTCGAACEGTDHPPVSMDVPTAWRDSFYAAMDADDGPGTDALTDDELFAKLDRLDALRQVATEHLAAARLEDALEAAAEVAKDPHEADDPRGPLLLAQVCAARGDAADAREHYLTAYRQLLEAAGVDFAGALRAIRDGLGLKMWGRG